MILSEVLAKVKKRRARKRCGRGRGSGLGKTSGRGQKGASSRSGFRLRLSYEGGQASLIRHLPKRGFSNCPFRVRYDVVNVSDLEAHFSDGETVQLSDLKDRGVLNPENGRLKVLGGGELKKKLNVVASVVSKSARQKIEAAGGKVEETRPKKKWRRRGKAKKVAAKPAEAAKGGEPKQAAQEKKGSKSKEKPAQ